MRCQRTGRRPRKHKTLPCTYGRYAAAVLHQANLQGGHPYVACLVAVMIGESSRAAWNPMDTTLRRPGATPYNTFGDSGALHVWDYPTAASGVSATVATILQPNMAEWTDLLRHRGHDAAQLAAGFARVPWAYVGDRLPGEIVADWLTGARSYDRDWRLPVTGPGNWPYR